MERGYYRVYLEADDGDWITMYVPLKEDGAYDRNAPKPHLVKASLDDEYFGEIVYTGERYNRIVWGGPWPDSLTDMLRRPTEEGARFTVFDNDDRDSDRWEFTVRDMRRV